MNCQGSSNAASRLPAIGFATHPRHAPLASGPWLLALGPWLLAPGPKAP